MAASIPSRDQGTPFRVPTVFTAGFRFFFLSAGLFSVLAMTVWTLWLGIQAAGGEAMAVPIAMAPQLWHAHEMVFGYAVAVMAGFFVTAVPSWTGTKETGAAFVTFSGLVWLAGRLAVWFSAVLDPILVAAVDLAFVPVLSSAVIGRLAQKSQTRNMVFLALLTALFSGNLMMHLDWIGWTGGNAEAGARLGIFTSAAMIAVIGGRVVPAFTRNALIRQGMEDDLPRSRAWLDRCGILLSLLTTLACLPFVPETALGALCVAAGIVTLMRLTGWQGPATRKEPILWILHVAFLLLGAGYLLYGLTLLAGIWQETAALHLLAVGAIGSMTLAMMTRASLGHAGRPLTVSRPIVAAYLALIVAALVRAFALPVCGYFETMLLSGSLWILAFGLYSWVYFPILTQPRQRK
ncbi:NnrS family protein [Roseibium sediminicola]|uniref:NnrS family protein n=1 Tax=Roseibium sediminicola TaxID=2933272 RepID=A0ABT0GPE0_9HYPH|nr:NnrS family protein [Roseibium sp. CAU 1639]MCK7611115.1 NnrS family protein [Roseibium sp. CAU 1639]